MDNALTPIIRANQDLLGPHQSALENALKSTPPQPALANPQQAFTRLFSTNHLQRNISLIKPYEKRATFCICVTVALAVAALALKSFAIAALALTFLAGYTFFTYSARAQIVELAKQIQPFLNQLLWINSINQPHVDPSILFALYPLSQIDNVYPNFETIIQNAQSIQTATSNEFTTALITAFASAVNIDTFVTCNDLFHSIAVNIKSIPKESPQSLSELFQLILAYEPQIQSHWPKENFDAVLRTDPQMFYTLLPFSAHDHVTKEHLETVINKLIETYPKNPNVTVKLLNQFLAEFNCPHLEETSVPKLIEIFTYMCNAIIITNEGQKIDLYPEIFTRTSNFVITQNKDVKEILKLINCIAAALGNHELSVPVIANAMTSSDLTRNFLHTLIDITFEKGNPIYRNKMVRLLLSACKDAPRIQEKSLLDNIANLYARYLTQIVENSHTGVLDLVDQFEQCIFIIVYGHDPKKVSAFIETPLTHTGHYSTAGKIIFVAKQIAKMITSEQIGSHDRELSALILAIVTTPFFMKNYTELTSDDIKQILKDVNKYDKTVDDQLETRTTRLDISQPFPLPTDLTSTYLMKYISSHLLPTHFADFKEAHFEEMLSKVKVDHGKAQKFFTELKKEYEKDDDTVFVPSSKSLEPSKVIEALTDYIREGEDFSTVYSRHLIPDEAAAGVGKSTL